jgi:hypothetical protein
MGGRGCRPMLSVLQTAAGMPIRIKVVSGDITKKGFLLSVPDGNYIWFLGDGIGFDDYFGLIG